MDILLHKIGETSLFNHNKYSKWYALLIERAISRGKPKGYFEKHHIIPYCFSKSNAKINLVHLTGREHFIAHLLLATAVRDEFKSSMAFAIRKMLVQGKGQDRNVSSRTFQIGRELFAAAQSKRMVELWSDPDRRRTHSEKIKKTLATPEARTLKRDAALKSSTPEVVAKRAEGHRGRTHSEATKQKMRETYRLRMGL